jgi:thioredoxin 1
LHQRETKGGKKLKLKQSVRIIKALIILSIIFILLNSCSDQAGNESSSKAGIENSAKNLEKNQTEKLPLLVDLGKGTCIPCKKMKPILDELKVEYQGRAIVKIIDLRYEPQAAKKYGIRLIPTQIFFDAEGNEVYRHEGFMDKQAIKAKFAEVGVY